MTFMAEPRLWNSKIVKFTPIVIPSDYVFKEFVQNFVTYSSLLLAQFSSDLDYIRL